MPNGFVTTLATRLELQDVMTPGLKRAARAMIDLGVQAKVAAAPGIKKTADELTKMAGRAIVGRERITTAAASLTRMADTADITRPALEKVSASLRLTADEMERGARASGRVAREMFGVQRVSRRMRETALGQAEALRSLAARLDQTGVSIRRAGAATRWFNEPIIAFGVEHGPMASAALRALSSAAHGADHHANSKILVAGFLRFSCRHCNCTDPCIYIFGSSIIDGYGETCRPR